MRAFREAIFDIVAEHRPCSGRQVYYRAVVAGLVDKDTGTSRKNETRVARALNDMREAFVDCDAPIRLDGDDYDAGHCRELGVMPFEWITDDTRTRWTVRTYADRDQALQMFHDAYRRDLWRTQPRLVEVWCESSSLGTVLLDVTSAYGVDLVPCRGQAGKRFLWDAARHYEHARKPVTCLYVGDFDPAGLDIGTSVEHRLRRYLLGSDVEIDFQRVAITADQVRSYGLPGHGVNANISDSQRRRFFDVCDWHGIPRESVEAEAMPPEQLRDLLRRTIEQYIDPHAWQLERMAEQHERKSILDMIGGGA